MCTGRRVSQCTCRGQRTTSDIRPPFPSCLKQGLLSAPCKPGWLTHSMEHWRGRGYRRALLQPARWCSRDLNSGLHTSVASTLTPQPSPRPSSIFLEYSVAVSSNVCGFCSFFPVDLLGLLNWRSNSQNIKHNLKKLMEVDGGEIVKV